MDITVHVATLVVRLEIDVAKVMSTVIHVGILRPLLLTLFLV